jgi:hypothetical protein
VFKNCKYVLCKAFYKKIDFTKLDKIHIHSMSDNMRLNSDNNLKLLLRPNDRLIKMDNNSSFFKKNNEEMLNLNKVNSRDIEFSQESNNDSYKGDKRCKSTRDIKKLVGTLKKYKYNTEGK